MTVAEAQTGARIEAHEGNCRLDGRRRGEKEIAGDLGRKVSSVGFLMNALANGSISNRPAISEVDALPSFGSHHRRETSAFC